MRSMLLAAVAVTGLSAVTTLTASAAPVTTVAGVQVVSHQGQPDPIAPDSGFITHVDYYWNHHHWHHRRWNHGHWHYY